MDEYQPSDEEIEAAIEDYYPDPDTIIDGYDQRYEKHKGTSHEYAFALDLVEVLIEFQKPIPVKLYPFIGSACDAWKISKGPKNIVRIKNTDQKWRRLVQSIDLLIKFEHLSLDDAITRINPPSHETLRKKYYEKKMDKD